MRQIEISLSTGRAILAQRRAVHCHSWGLAEYLAQYLRGRNDLKDRIARDYGIAGDNRIAGNYMFSSGELSLTESYRRGH
jgi:hypothetical protein